MDGKLAIGPFGITFGGVSAGTVVFLAVLSFLLTAALTIALFLIFVSNLLGILGGQNDWALIAWTVFIGLWLVSIATNHTNS